LPVVRHDTLYGHGSLLYSGILTTMLLVEVVVKTQFCSCMGSWHPPVHWSSLKKD
jgi:hypothetical protein